jgi:hypothetical protein
LKWPYIYLKYFYDHLKFLKKNLKGGAKDFL